MIIEKSTQIRANQATATPPTTLCPSMCHPASDGTLPGLCSSLRNIPGIAQAGPGIFLLPVCLFVLANSGGNLADAITVTEAGGDKVVGVWDLIAAHGNESVRMRPCRGHTKTTYPFSFQAFPYSAASLNDRKPKSSSDPSLRASRSGWRDPLEFQENGISTQVLAIRELRAKWNAHRKIEAQVRQIEGAGDDFEIQSPLLRLLEDSAGPASLRSPASPRSYSTSHSKSRPRSFSFERN